MILTMLEIPIAVAYASVEEPLCSSLSVSYHYQRRVEEPGMACFSLLPNKG